MRQSLRLISTGTHADHPNETATRTQVRPPYLFLRHGTYYFKRKVPRDVTFGFPEFPSGQMWRSLGTGLLTQARILLAVEVTEFELRVAQLRREVAQQRARAPVVSSTGTSGATNLHAPGTAFTPVSFAYQLPWGGGASWPVGPYVSPSVAAPPAHKATGRHAQARRTSDGAIRTMTQAHATSAPAAVEPATPPARQAQRGKAPSTPNKIAPVRSRQDSAAVNTTILHLYEAWKLTQTRPRTLATVQTTVMEFRTMHGALPVAAIAKSHARAYRDVLIERGLSKRSIENRLGHLSTLVRFGMREIIEDHTLNAFERIDIVGATGLRPAKERRAYTIAELNTIFSSRLYTDDYRPGGQVTDAAYWMPILGPFVGARIEELCQLRVEDVQRVNGSWCVRICDLDDDQKVKTLSSFRRVPLHEVVIRAGFLVYAAKMAAAGHERVFPTLSNENCNGTYSNAVGKWFARYLDTVGLSDPRLDYHSYRYTFRQQASLCGCENETRDALTGHWLSNNDSGRTYMKAEQRQYPYPLLVGAMSKLRYDGLTLDHLYVAEPMQGVERLLSI